jgi:hypothetical protein
MFVKVQKASNLVACSSTDKENWLRKTAWPVNTELSQIIIIIPLDLPTDGIKAKESKFLGQNCLRNCRSTYSLLDS